MEPIEIVLVVAVVVGLVESVALMAWMRHVFFVLVMEKMAESEVECNTRP